VEALGRIARAARPEIIQVLVARPGTLVPDLFEHELRHVRIELELRASEAGLDGFYVASCSARTITYKALVTSEDLPAFYSDLTDERYKTPFAVFHRRFSTNTSPTWALTQPFRMVAHNGEINTIAGNRAWMRARAGARAQADGASDSATLDEALCELSSVGREPCEAMSLLMPPAWENDPELPQGVRDFFEWHSASMEPWDGPAFVVFTDGRSVGATLDRNGLRPARYSVAADGLIVVASEAGVVDVAPHEDTRRGRLGPGDIIAVDLERGRLLERNAIRSELAGRARYREWLERDRLVLLPVATPPMQASVEALRALGITREELQLVLGPMIAEGNAGVGSMGDDTPLAVLSPRPRMLSDYFRQRFAQVTNPPIDPLRETLVMSLRVRLGARTSLDNLDAARARIDLPSPVLTPEELEGLIQERRAGWTTTTLPLTLPKESGVAGFKAALEAIVEASCRAVDEGASLLVLDDRGLDADNAAIPALLAVSAIHQALVRTGRRIRTSLAVVSGEARDDHHLATLLAFGAEAVCPWVGFALIRGSSEHLARLQLDTDAERRYRRALEKGLLKILSKMGISTVRSYIGSQLFEVIGLADDLVDTHFTATPSLVGGLTLDDVAAESLVRHDAGFASDLDRLDTGGFHRFRRNGDAHAFAPNVVKALHASIASGEKVAYKAYAKLVHERPPIVLRDLFEIREAKSSLSIDSIEPVASLLPRFMSAAMSLGALSPEAHEVLAEGMRRLSGRSNSGEGGEDRARNAIKQVASARFGVTTDYLVDAAELQIKIAQGSKPGEGGQLPGHKTVAHIARVRRAPEGTTLISPPPHHDIYSIEDLAQLVYDLKQVNPTATIGVKLVSQAGIGTVAAGVAKAGADAILIGGHDGGTGASALASIKHAGTPWELGLAEAQQALVANGLRHRVRLQVEGGLKTGRDVVIAGLLGADEFGFGTAPLVAMGCVMARQCHLDTCPAGIATQREDLRAKFTGEPEDVVRFFTAIADEVREILAAVGVGSFAELIGAVERLAGRTDVEGKAASVDLSHVLAEPGPGPRSFQGGERAPREIALDDAVVEKLRLSPVSPEPLTMSLPITNTDRAAGARVAGELARRYSSGALPNALVRVSFRGSAGQSFGAFAVSGMRLELEGEANDGLGKGLSGGELVVRAPDGWGRSPILAGNAALYGATGGSLFLAGRAGERFAVRNSGAIAVVEGLGDHGCEYMTDGAVVVLGAVGRNFGAGMSGGVAFVLDEKLNEKLNDEMVSMGEATPADGRWLARVIERHRDATGSALAARLLERWPDAIGHFRRITPRAAAPRPLPEWDDREIVATVPMDTELETLDEKELV
jgi:glutamate synthase domain-containing protein 2/glutamate synthase domain-containing protein 3